MNFSEFDDGALRSFGVRQTGASVLSFERTMLDRVLGFAAATIAVIIGAIWAHAALNTSSAVTTRLAAAVLLCVTGSAAMIALLHGVSAHNVRFDTASKTYELTMGLFGRKRSKGSLAEIEFLRIDRSPAGGRGGHNVYVYIYWEDPTRPRVLLGKFADRFVASAVIRRLAEQTGLAIVGYAE